MTLANAAAARVRLIGWCLPFGEPHGLPGARRAAIRLSPLRHHFVPPKVAQVPIPPKYRDDTAPRLPFPIGVGGWSVPVVGATIQI
jgi:hypothetical protein